MPTDRGKLPAYVQARKDEWIVVEENKRAARFHNPAHEVVLVVAVDGKMIVSGERADYIVAHPKVVDVIVELKGSDVSKAISQIRATRPAWGCHGLAGSRFAALVVRGQGIRPKLQANMESWKREFRKTFKMKLVIEARNRDHEFGEFLLPENPRD